MIQTKAPYQSRAIKTKQKIIDTSFKLFFKNGYKKTNTILIAKEAQVSVGVVYSYFKDKNELFELWLNSLLERSDDYFYNQFKLKEYDVELNLIISNIIEKTTDMFFKSPLIKEEQDDYLKFTLNNFYEKIQQIFIKGCFDNDIFFKNPLETTHIIFNLLRCYNLDLEMNNSSELLKNKYISTIIFLLTNN